MNLKNDGEHPWATVFMEIVLRAMRRVHYEYGVRAVPQPSSTTPEKARRLNRGAAVELADERLVCAAITMEFAGSPLVSGLWAEAANQERREFDIQSEFLYKSNTKLRADFFVKKIRHIDETSEEIQSPSYIEAKRFSIWKVENVIEAVSASPQRCQIRSDIDKLRKEIKHRKGLGAKFEIYGHLLVWGVCDLDGKKAARNTLSVFEESFRDAKLIMHSLRWLPIDWEDSQLARPFTVPRVTRWIWVALVEVSSA